MSEHPTYGVTVQREDQLWVAVIDGLPSTVNHATDVEHFADLDNEVRDFIAATTDTDTDSFDLAWHYVQGDRDYTVVVEHLREQDSRARLATQQLESARTDAIRSMRAAGLSLRAIADALGMSHQRIDQLSKRVS